MSVLKLPEDEDRFIMDCEFVQSLTNARYLHFLAVEGYFENQAFLNYLRYLKYWKEDKYRVYLTLPQCLAVLDALNDNLQFKLLCKHPNFKDVFHQEQGTHWSEHFKQPVQQQVDQLQQNPSSTDAAK